MDFQLNLSHIFTNLIFFIFLNNTRNCLIYIFFLKWNRINPLWAAIEDFQLQFIPILSVEDRLISFDSFDFTFVTEDEANLTPLLFMLYTDYLYLSYAVQRLISGFTLAQLKFLTFQESYLIFAWKSPIDNNSPFVFVVIPNQSNSTLLRALSSFIDKEIIVTIRIKSLSISKWRRNGIGLETVEITLSSFDPSIRLRTFMLTRLVRRKRSRLRRRFLRRSQVNGKLNIPPRRLHWHSLCNIIRLCTSEFCSVGDVPVLTGGNVRRGKCLRFIIYVENCRAGVDCNSNREAIHQLTGRFRLQFYRRCRPGFINIIPKRGYLLNFADRRSGKVSMWSVVFFPVSISFVVL